MCTSVWFQFTLVPVHWYYFMGHRLFQWVNLNLVSWQFNGWLITIQKKRRRRKLSTACLKLSTKFILRGSMSHKLRVESLKMWGIQVQWGSNERCYHTEQMRWYLPWGAISRDGSSRRNPRTVLSLWFTLFETSVIWYILCHPDRLCTATRSNRSIQQLGWTKTHLHTFIAWYLGIHTLRLSGFSGFGNWTNNPPSVLWIM